MTISTRQVEFLARAIVNRLEDRSMAEFEDAEKGIAIVSRVLAGNLRQACQLELDACERLAAGGHDPDSVALDDEVRRLADERGFIL